MSAVLDEHTQFVDSGGKPVVNGFLYFGVVDSDPVTNPISIFSDRELTTPLANPQRTDANGRAVNKVWLSGQYSFRLSDSNNNQLYQELDNGEDEAGGTIILGNVQGGNTIVAGGTPAIVSYTDKSIYVLTVAQVNTGPVTLNIDNLGAVPIVKNGGTPILAGEFKANAVLVLVYNAASAHFDWVNQTEPVFNYEEENANFTVVLTDRAKIFNCTAAITASISAASSLGAGFVFTIKAVGADVTIDPDGAETIDGASTLVVSSGSSARVICDGSNFHTEYVTGQTIGYETQSANFTVDSTDRSKLIDCTATLTASLTAAATLGAGWYVYLKANGGDITVDPNGAETIDGQTTIILPNGSSAIIECDGTNFHTVIMTKSGAPSAVLEHQEAQGTNGGSPGSSNTWVTRTLNTVVFNPAALVSLSADEFTVIKDGWVEYTALGSRNFTSSNAAQSRLYNVTDAAVVGLSTPNRFGGGDSTSLINYLMEGGGLVLAGKTYRIETNSSNIITGDNAFGENSNRGTEVYLRVRYYAL